MNKDFPPITLDPVEPHNYMAVYYRADAVTPEMEAYAKKNIPSTHQGTTSIQNNVQEDNEV